MKASQKKFAAAVLGCAALFTGGSGYAGDDLDTCRAGYRTLLMTPGECRGYLQELGAAQARSDQLAVLDLQEWHTELLIERSQACPCELKPAAMARVRADMAGQPRLAFSGKQ